MWRVCLPVLLACFLGACGDDPTEPENDSTTAESGTEEAPWSEPAVVEGVGSPDGDGSPVKSAESLLTALRSRIDEGRGHSDPSFDKNVQDVAAVLWASDASVEVRQAAQVHMQVAAIAGEVGRWLSASEGARAEREASNPTDVALFDAFLVAAGKGPEAYRTWCSTDGAKLLEAHAEAAYRRHFPPRSGGKK